VVILNRKNSETYRMRGTKTRPSDLVTRWERVINGRTIEFARIAWMGGREGYTIRAEAGVNDLHVWHFNANGEMV
jgi:hypothetical protein